MAVALIFGLLWLGLDDEKTEPVTPPAADSADLTLKLIVGEKLSAQDLGDIVESSPANTEEAAELPSLLVEEAPDVAVKGLFRRWRAPAVKPAPRTSETRGFLGNGSAIFTHSSPPRTWSKTQNIRWVKPMDSWSNSSPVITDGKVFTTSEPLSLLCLDAETGALLWKREGDFASTLDEEAREKLSAFLGKARDLAVEMEKKQRELYRLKRALRKNKGTPELVGKMKALEEEVNEMRAQVSEMDRFREPPPMEFIGYSASTPVTDGVSIYAVFGNGVVTRFDLDGNRLWSTWLGDPVRPMNGNDRGHASSPILRDGVLVVGYGKVLALDATTGALKWQTSRVFRDYGTSGFMSLGGRDVVVKPDGELIDLQTGESLNAPLDDLYYLGPHVVGDRVFFMGSSTESQSAREEVSIGRAFRYSLSETGKAVATRLWDVPLEYRYYFTAPILDDQTLFHVSGDGQLRAYNAEDGSVTHTLDLPPNLKEPVDVYPSPVLVGGLLYITSDMGTTAVFDPAKSSVVSVNRLEEKMRSTPTFSDGRLFIRTFENLYSIGAD